MTVTTPHVSSIDYNPAIMQPTVIPVTASITEATFLGLPLAGDPFSTKDLLRMVKETYKVDAVINTCVETESGSILGVLGEQTITLTGLGVKFKNP
jgi:hypothetical protein